MTTRPIISSAPMVRALLAGTKTQTRRLATSPLRRCEVGDRLWVRENLGYQWAHQVWWYRADDVELPTEWQLEAPRRDRWPLGVCNSIHMPQSAHRLILIVEAVRVEPLQAISRANAIAEGLTHVPGVIEPDWWRLPEPLHQGTWLSPLAAYAFLWGSLHTKPGETWADNPDVVALTFRVEQRNIDR